MSEIYTRSGKGSALIHAELDANFTKAAQAKTALYTVATSDNRDTIECAGTFTVTLPVAAAAVAAIDSGDFEVTIKCTSGTITIARSSTDTINGATSLTLIAGESVLLKVNQAGTGYNVLTGNVNTLGLTSTVAELNILDGVTATASELNDVVSNNTGTSSGTNTGDQDASGVSITDSGGYYTASDVEAALAELRPQTGTWTPTLEGSSVAGTGWVFSSQVGNYSRVGNIILYTIRIAASTVSGTAAGALYIKGLPFNIGGTSILHRGSAGVYGVTVPTNGYGFHIGGAGSTALSFKFNVSGGVQDEVQVADIISGFSVDCSITVELD